MIQKKTKTTTTTKHMHVHTHTLIDTFIHTFFIFAVSSDLFKDTLRLLIYTYFQLNMSFYSILRTFSLKWIWIELIIKCIPWSIGVNINERVTYGAGWRFENSSGHISTEMDFPYIQFIKDNLTYDPVDPNMLQQWLKIHWGSSRIYCWVNYKLSCPDATKQA